jgi:hypothetical protein
MTTKGEWNREGEVETSHIYKHNLAEDKDYN